MASCSSNGRPKVRHRTSGQAWRAAASLAKEENLRVRYDIWAYKCPDCEYWHIGHANAWHYQRRLEHYQAAVDNALVGKLIKALKEVINGQHRPVGLP